MARKAELDIEAMGTGILPSMYIHSEQKAFLAPADVTGKQYDPVPFGIYHFDKEMPMGVSPYSPVMYFVQGGRGSRKTTFFFNIVLNQMLSMTLPNDYKFVWFSLETSMTVERIALIFCSMIASKLLFYWNLHIPFDMEGTYKRITEMIADKDRAAYGMESLVLRRALYDLFSVELNKASVEDSLVRPIPEIDLRPDKVIRALAYPTREDFQLSEWQRIANAIARCAFYTFNLEIFGPSEHSDLEIRKERRFDSTNPENVWRLLGNILQADGYAKTQIIIDHVTAFRIPGTVSWEIQSLVGPEIKHWIGEFASPFWVISQEGISHQRDYQRYGTVFGSEGGDYLARECDANWRKMYNSNNKPWYDIILSPPKLRRGSHPDLAQPIIAPTGAYVGKSITCEEAGINV